MQNLSTKGQIAYYFCLDVLLPAQKSIWKGWQQANPGFHWTKNNLWDLCYFACLGRYLPTEEAAEIATRITNEQN